MPTSEPDFPNGNRICPNCVGERHLKNLIRTDGALEFCSYCEEESPTLSIEEVADLVEHAFDDHYERTATEPDGFEYAMLRDPDSNYDWEREGEAAMWAILNAVNTTEEIAEDIRSVLADRHYDHELAQMCDECPFSKESQYAEKDAGHGEFLRSWRDFEHDLKTKARFFSPVAKSILHRIFDGVPDLRTIEGSPVVVAAGPGTQIATLYRARVFAGEDNKLKEALEAPWKHLGTPPSEAARAGRMNAHSIAVFYGARDSTAALSEVRPPVGSKVAVANFEIVRPLRLLDLAALKSVATGGSIFDPSTIRHMQRSNFLEILSSLMSRAVMPHEEASEYLPTQAVADYLANAVRLDGILFPSVQTGQQSSNVVLFHHAARVEEVKLPEGTKVDARLDSTDSDGTHPDYWVWEEIPQVTAQDEAPPATSPIGHFRFDPSLVDTDSRPPSLRIDLESIQIHHVKAVSFDAEPHSVTRHRFTAPI